MDKTAVAIARSQVNSITPVDELEHRDILDTLHWIDSGVELYRIKKPDVPPKHLVSYIVPVDMKARRILLGHHRKAQRWIPPGGHVEINEDPRKTVKRETMEELHLNAQFLANYNQPLFITVSPTVGAAPSHIDVSLWYMIIADSQQQIVFDPAEFTTIKWYSLLELLQPTSGTFDPHLSRFIRKLQRFMDTFNAPWLRD